MEGSGMRQLDGTDLEVFPLCLGGNVFGWTADRSAAFNVLDTYKATGGNFIDTADVYCSWMGENGGQSETIIGEWHTARANRDELVLATKVGQKPDRLGVTAGNIHAAADESLRRLQTDRIDIYLAHIDDEAVPLEETLGAMSELVQAGKVRYIGGSNYTAPRLEEALAVSDRGGLPRYVVLQPEYNLMQREFEADLAHVCAREQVACTPYFGLAGGFLTGKYRREGDGGDSPRADHASSHLGERGTAVLEALGQIAEGRGVAIGAVALAWLAAKPTVVAPLASARSPGQLAEIIAMADLELSREEMTSLDSASSATVTPADNAIA
jgi:aryl-alcohol dehydrogenase-like predicted oxidoreductase